MKKLGPCPRCGDFIKPCSCFNNKIPKIITKIFLDKNPKYIFVFGDNTIRKGKKGAAVLRDHPQSYGFITKKYPSYNKDAYYKPNEYKSVFVKELIKLIVKIEENSDKTFLISEIGGGLANKHGIFQKVIKPGLKSLKEYKNVIFLFEL